tara:strand:+ start:5026 stop:14784 length:9759 start_codon:yes stop_codon:yes gene_type:complete
MSIKKLFDSNRNYSGYADDKERYEFVESKDNAAQILKKDLTFTPQIDYSDPANFIKYSSAYLFYKGALDKISDYYPYDGSSAEKTKFYNSLLEGEKYIFDSLYPSSTGYILLSADGWGSRSGAVTSDGYGLPSSLEYITFKGGPLSSSSGPLSSQGPNPESDKIHHANIYDENIYRTAGLPDSYGKGTRLSNLRSNFDTGVTVEFWLKKPAFTNTNTSKEVILDVWNNFATSSNSYGRLTIELTGAATGSPFIFTVQSGTTSTALKHTTIGNDFTTASITGWNHFAFSFYNTGSNFVVKLYKNGVLNDFNTYNSNINELNSKGMMGRIGALLTAPSGSSATAGAGKLSGSLDEFRFWKVTRNSQQINRNWFDNVEGGTNTDISNTTLGVYYKFNEGIVGSSSIDSIVLDYAGRISNGTWTGYDSYSRNTGSAIVSSSAAIFEKQDPIIRTQHTQFLNLSSSLMGTGSWYDLNNNSAFVNYVPSWIIEDHENNSNENLKVISHIMGSYFDKLYLLAEQIPKIKQVNYFTASVPPVPFARHLPQSLGLYTPDTFIDSSIVERLLNRGETTLFEGNLQDTKNEIYVNLYNNLTNIFKSKGTTRAIKNVFRCFNLDDSLLQFRQYSSNTTYDLENNLVQKNISKNYSDFSKKLNTGSVVYQAVDSSNANSSGYISGSYGSPNEVGVEDPFGATVEASITFPFYIKRLTYDSRNNLSSSLFGLHTVNTASAASLNGTLTTLQNVYSKQDYANFQVYAVRDKKKSKNAYFLLTSSFSPYPIPALSSSVFFDVYNNNNWNFSVRLRPTGYPLAGLVSGSLTYTYDVIFKGTNSVLGTVYNSFEVSSSISYALGSNFLRSPKRIYIGSRRENITGSLLVPSDVMVSNVKYWTKFLDNQSLLQHTKDQFNAGISGSYQNISPLHPSGSNLDLLNANTLALNWDFETVTSSNSTGNFVVTDYSSGSALIRNNFNWLGKVSGYQHTGYGYNFPNSSENVIERRQINNFEFVDPEQVVSSEMINILDQDDMVFDIEETVPDYLFTLEKSMQNAVSDEMLKFFAGVIDFNNVIGAPVNRYRDRYKDLEKLREVFFRRVTKTSNVEKFIGYYKWFDDAISTIVEQLIPASADYIPDVMNVIEPYVLERNKYQTKFPTLEFKQPDIEAPIYGINEQLYNARTGRSPVSASQWISKSKRNQAYDILYWKDRAERDSTELSSGNATINTQRQTVRRIVASQPFLSKSLPLVRTIDGTRYQVQEYQRRNFQRLYTYSIKTGSTIHGGVNFEPSKKIEFTYNALYPAGPVDDGDGGMFIPQNVLVSFMNELENLPVNKDPKPDWIKTKRHIKVYHGRDYGEGLTYSNVKSSIAFPFNLFDTTVNSGFQAIVNSRITGNVTITNLHNDVYGPHMEKPMQGPFTNYAVGGHQSRHIRINTGSDTYYNRPEAWKLLLGTCNNDATTIAYSGAIGMAGADYPWPEANAVGARPYPMTASQKAVYYRDMIAKRPLNIRNIRHTTGAVESTSEAGRGFTVLGNFNHNYDVVNTFGAYSNPRAFIENQPTLPVKAFPQRATSSTSTNTILDIHRYSGVESLGRTLFVPDYAVNYLRGNISPPNKSVIRTKFGAPGGIETSTPAYTDFRSDEYSVYNTINYRNLTVIKPQQGPSGTLSTFAANLQTGSIRVNDIHGKPFGLRALLARHSAQFGRDSLWITGTTARVDGPEQTAGGPGATYNQFPSFQKVNRNKIRQMKINAAGAYYTSSIYDNAFITQQIPKSTLQYAWITASYKTLNDRFGIVRSDFRVSTSAGYKDSIEFLQSGEFISYNAAGVRIFGKDERFVGGSPHGRTDFVGLNTNVLDVPVTSSSLLGNSTTLTDYYNSNLIDGLNTEGTASIFNALILNRQGPYGWPSWKHLRVGDQSKLLRLDKRNNRVRFLSSTGSHGSTAEFEMPPVSLRGRTLQMAIEDPNAAAPPGFEEVDAPTTSTKEAGPGGASAITEGVAERYVMQAWNADFSNNYIYFNRSTFDDQFNLSSDDKITAGEQALQIATSENFALDWVIYTENIFPSQRNEFLSHSRTRLGYDNKYWRNSNADRVTLGDTLDNSLDIDISQSSWPLDAPSDFMTRTKVPFVTWLVVPTTSSAQLKAARNTLANSASAGEMQNTYSTYFTSSNHITRLSRFECGGILTPGVLYARKQTISTPTSVVSPSGMIIPQTGSGKPLPFASTKQIQVFAGEALWEAGSKAGILVSTTASAAIGRRAIGSPVKWVSRPTLPWFNSYEDFNYLIKKVSDSIEFAVVPEYRYSEHVETYQTVGFFNEGNWDTFHIPETNISSSDDTFYLDYSNSEFLKEFLKVEELSGLKAKEIRLVCSGTIRFNPYKGFYPAQRTIDIANMFWKTYGYPDWQTDLGDYTESGQISGSSPKCLYQPFFAPGILYNSIKSGLAVDWPLVMNFDKIDRVQYGDSVTGKKDNWAITTLTASMPAQGPFYDYRVPFEALIQPRVYVDSTQYVDMDAHPSCSLVNITHSFNPGGGDDTLYTAMVSNFIAETMNCFLENSGPTKIKSNPFTTKLIQSGSVYGARLKIRRSMSGSRDYSYESGSSNTGFTTARAYFKDGGRRIVSNSAGTVFNFSQDEKGFPIPQDPIRNSKYRENFTMYSRPTAFGPPTAGISEGQKTTMSKYATETVFDSFNGSNTAYTPPYYNGEAWCDLIFRASSSVNAAGAQYTLADIMANTKAIYWRIDPGYATGSFTTATNPQKTHRYATTLVYDETLTDGKCRAPYTGQYINQHSMQLSASINIFGRDRVQVVEDIDPVHVTLDPSGESTYEQWVIQPKWETPMLNFSDLSEYRPLISSEISLPSNYGQASVPRGMWHQFGIIDSDFNRGIYLEISDIPPTWLENHYDTLINDTIYNNYNAKISGSNVIHDMKSLVDLVGFETAESSVKLGRIKDSLTIEEAVVAVPYIVETIDRRKADGTYEAYDLKKFISIPGVRVLGATSSPSTTRIGDSLEAAGESVRRQIEMMQKYIFPPELDFLTWSDEIDPMVMYVFEFSYTFDKDDLSYIWQNTAPRDYKQITKQATSVSHELINTELLSEANLSDNETLRWMIFKVKQRSQRLHSDFKTSDSINAPATHLQSYNPVTETFEVASLPPRLYNWPYDYLSFVEKVSIDVQVLFKEDEDVLTHRDDSEVQYELSTGPMNNPLGSQTLADLSFYNNIVGADQRISSGFLAPVTTNTAGNRFSTMSYGPANVRLDTGKLSRDTDSDSDFQEMDIDYAGE